MSTRMRSTKSQAKSKRSHHRIKSPALSKSDGSSHLRHRVSPTTGMYRGRQVISIKTKASKNSDSK